MPYKGGTDMLPTQNERLTHLNEAGEARMVDVTEKHMTVREATAHGRVVMQSRTLELIRDHSLAKGDVLAVARVAGVMAAKRTSELIPLCHGLPVSFVEIEFSLDESTASLEILARVRVEARTGVEMEALTAVAVAGLTIYDMCKSVDRGMRITDVRLTLKSGGKSGSYEAL
jgi:cyclic pyranopterin phosphate synthase